MVAADSVLVGTVTRMTSALWIAKRAVARGGVEETFFRKDEAVDFIQQSCSTECTQSLLSSEPDVYGCYIKETRYPKITGLGTNKMQGVIFSLIVGFDIETFQTLSIILDEVETPYNRSYILGIAGGMLLDRNLLTLEPLSASFNYRKLLAIPQDLLGDFTDLRISNAIGSSLLSDAMLKKG